MRYYNSRVLIGSAAIGYQPLYHTRKIAAIEPSSGRYYKMKLAKSSRFWLFLLEQLLHSRLLDLRGLLTLGVTHLVGFLSSYVTRARGIVVKYS